MKRPFVSILIPAYNAKQWISRAISSALNQTWPHREIIVVDDGSTDGTLSVASQFSKDGVTVVPQPNHGASAARNHAYSLCRGDYIQWLDADDVLAPDKISRQLEVVETLDNPRLLLSSEWGRFLYRTKGAQFAPTVLWQDQSPLDWLLRKMTFNVWMQPGSWLASRELSDASGPWDERLSFDDDGEYFCRMMTKSQGVVFVRGAKTYYRMTGPGSLSSMVDTSNKKMESAWLSIGLQIQCLRQLEDSERTHKAAVSFLQTWVTMFHPLRPDIVKQMLDLAKGLGGEVNHLTPLKLVEALRWKFAWIEGIFGSRCAHWAQKSLPQFKHFMIGSARRFWDRTLFQLGYE